MVKSNSKKSDSKEKVSPKDTEKNKSKHKLKPSSLSKNDAAAANAKKAKTGSAKKSKAAKKQNDAELDDSLLTDEVEATEEIPDLADFDEAEEAESEADDTDDTTDDSSDLNADGEQLSGSTVPGEDEEVILTDAEGRRLCRVRECDQAAIVELYCRFHYLQNWKRIQVRRKILADGKLSRYVDELTSRYPDKFLEMIRKDLRTEKDFLTAIAELEIDESAVDSDFEDESQNFIDEVRGVTETTISDDDDGF